MKSLQRISKKANAYLNQGGFTKEDLKNGVCQLYRTRNGYAVRLDIQEVPPKGKKKLFRGLNTPQELISEALVCLDKDQPSIALKALAIATRIIEKDLDV